MNYNVNTIYPAFMGEVNTYGIGCPCTFVRLSGCNLRCYKATKGFLCDTPEALDCKSGTRMSTDEIINRLTHIGNKVICLTGGEPLLQDITELLTELSYHGFKVVIETNGSVRIDKYRHIRNVSFVVDCKGPSSGEMEKMLESNYSLLDKDDYVKFVVDNEEDYAHFAQWIFTHGTYVKCCVAVGTFWGSEIDYQELLKKLQNDGINVYLNMQTHKMACLYDHYKNDEDFGKIFIPKEL